MLWLDSDYRQLVNKAINRGLPVQRRNGMTRVLVGETIAADLADGFPIIGTRRVFWRGVAGELAAFLEGATSLKRFEALGCRYWRYNAEQWPNFDGDNLGPIYGAQWRNFRGVDQLQELLAGLRNDPSSRRHVLTTWNPAELRYMCLPPCHLLAQFHVIENQLHQTVYMRSVDLCLGLPSDLVLYGLLQLLIAKELGLEPRRLVMMLGDAHVYEGHIETWLTRQNVARIPAHEPRMILADDATPLVFHPGQCALVDYTTQEIIGYELY